MQFDNDAFSEANPSSSGRTSSQLPEVAGGDGLTAPTVIYLPPGVSEVQLVVRRGVPPAAKPEAKVPPQSGFKGRHPETAWELVLAQLAMVLFEHGAGEGPLDETVRFDRSEHAHRVLKRNSRRPQGSVSKALAVVHERFRGREPASMQRALSRARNEGTIAAKLGSRFRQPSKLAEWEEVAEQFVLDHFPMTVPPRDG